MWNIVEMHMVHLMMLELAELSLDEPELEAMLFLDDGNEGEENETEYKGSREQEADIFQERIKRESFAASAKANY